MRSAAILALAATLVYGAADTTTTKKPVPAPSTKSKAASKSKTSSKSKTASKSKAAAGTSKTAKSSAHRSTTAKSGKSSKSKTAAKHGKTSNSASAAAWRSRQLAPTPERYKEIQQALVDKGYLKSEPNGVWDAESTAAMTQFQTDQKLSPTGKLSAASLIALGLGPKTAEGAQAAPPEN